MVNSIRQTLRCYRTLLSYVPLGPCYLTTRTHIYMWFKLPRQIAIQPSSQIATMLLYSPPCTRQTMPCRTMRCRTTLCTQCTQCSSLSLPLSPSLSLSNSSLSLSLHLKAQSAAEKAKKENDEKRRKAMETKTRSQIKCMQPTHPPTRQLPSSPRQR